MKYHYFYILSTFKSSSEYTNLCYCINESCLSLLQLLENLHDDVMMDFLPPSPQKKIFSKHVRNFSIILDVLENVMTFNEKENNNCRFREHLCLSQLSVTKGNCRTQCVRGKGERDVTDKETSIIHTSCECVGKIQLHIQTKKQAIANATKSSPRHFE